MSSSSYPKKKSSDLSEFLPFPPCFFPFVRAPNTHNDNHKTDKPECRCIFVTNQSEIYYEIHVKMERTGFKCSLSSFTAFSLLLTCFKYQHSEFYNYLHKNVYLISGAVIAHFYCEKQEFHLFCVKWDSIG